MKRQVREGFALIVVAMSLGACSAPEVDVRDIEGTTLDVALGQLAERNLVLGTIEPKVAPDGDGVAAWIVETVTSNSDPIREGDTVNVTVTSVLQRASRACLHQDDTGDGGGTLILDMEGKDFGSGNLSYNQVMCILEDLEVPERVMGVMEKTRSLDGRQQDEWNGIRASWGYHPDSGLDVILTVQD